MQDLQSGYQINQNGNTHVLQRTCMYWYGLNCLHDFHPPTDSDLEHHRERSISKLSVVHLIIKGIYYASIYSNLTYDGVCSDIELKIKYIPFISQ